MQASQSHGSNALNWSLAAIIAAVLSTSHLLDTGNTFDITDHSTEHAQAAALQDAINAESAHARYTQAAAAMCGPNAGYLETADGAIACTTHKGKRTGVVVQASLASAQ